MNQDDIKCPRCHSRLHSVLQTRRLRLRNKDNGSEVERIHCQCWHCKTKYSFLSTPEAKLDNKEVEKKVVKKTEEQIQQSEFRLF